MKKIAIERARNSLDQAREAVEKMNLENGKEAYMAAWSRFLSDSSRFYNRLKGGAKGCQTSEPWFGRKKHERKNDPLLSYIHHARDCDEHGLEYVVAETGSEAVATMADGADEFHFKLQVMIDDSGKTHVRNPQSLIPGSITKIELKDARMELVTVKDDRFKESFDPPKMHLGKPIPDQSPPAVARLALAYFETMLNEASELPQTV